MNFPHDALNVSDTLDDKLNRLMLVNKPYFPIGSTVCLRQGQVDEKDSVHE